MSLRSQTEYIDVPVVEIKEAPITSSKYHNFECCEWTRGVDTLLSRYKQDRELITSLMISDPDTLIKLIWTPDGPLAIDNECRCQMGQGEHRSPFACAQCKNLRRLIDFRLGGIERGFQIQCGQSAGSKLIVASSEILTPFLEWDDAAADRARFYVQQYHNLTMCGTPDVSSLRCITGDSFTIRTLLVWMISRLFEEQHLPHAPLLHSAFICRKIGYSIYTVPSIGSISDLHSIPEFSVASNSKLTPPSHLRLTEKVVRSIILQLLVILTELSTINFSHGTPSMYGLVFTKEPVSYAYDNVHVEGPLTVQISDLWNASATINNIHYFSKSIRDSMYLEKNMFVPHIETQKVSMAHCYDVGMDFDGKFNPFIVCPKTMTTCPDERTYAACEPRSVTMYKLTTSTIDIYTAMRHIGFPLYVGSFDFYSFMVSLMCDKPFFDAVKNSERLYRLWRMMWLIEDLPSIESMIEKAHLIEDQSISETGLVPNRRIASNVAVEIIRGKWLRCDIVKFIWSLIKQGW